MRRRWVGLAILFGAVAVLASVGAGILNETHYAQMCNASAAVALGDGLFVVADDEDKDPTPLRLYRIGQAGAPLSQAPIPDDVLDLDPSEDPEVDIEGAARLGEHVYWIGSHSASKDAKKRPNRRRLFATRLRVEGDRLKIERVGSPYKHLIRDLADDDSFAAFHLDEAAKREPKEDGALSVEGLASTPDDELLIGFRNPITAGKALLVRLKNPEEVIKGHAARFGKPIELDLGGLGVRSIERRGDSYVIFAGRRDHRRDFKLFRWSGDPDSAPQAVAGVELGDLNPEALFFDPLGAYALSDDGKLPIGGVNCEDLPRSNRRFRGVRLSPSP